MLRVRRPCRSAGSPACRRGALRRRRSSSPLDYAVFSSEICRDRNVVITRGPQAGGNVLCLSIADLEYEKARAGRACDLHVEAGAEECTLRLVVQLGLQPVERVDVRRVGDDELPPFGGGP